jgi:mannosyltransferase OCH1-like enzyme
MIPKKINYVWVGEKNIPSIFNHCKFSWERFCPDYELILWTENDINFMDIDYLNYAYSNKQYAMFADYYRLWIIYNYGGFYLDVDVELIKSLDSLRSLDIFFSVGQDGFVNGGSCFGSRTNNELLKLIMKEYESMNLEDFEYIPGPVIETKVIKELKSFDNEISAIKQLTLLPFEYFDPFDWQFKTGKIGDNTIGIHHYEGTWLSKKRKNQIKLLRFARPFIGRRMANFIDKLLEYLTD